MAADHPSCAGLCHVGSIGIWLVYRITLYLWPAGQVAQLVEQWTENPCVGGSIPSLTTPKNAKPLVGNDLQGACSFWGPFWGTLLLVLIWYDDLVP